MKSYVAGGTYDSAGHQHLFKAKMKFRIKYRLTSTSTWSYSGWSTEVTMDRNQAYTTTVSQSVTAGNYYVAAEYVITQASTSYTVGVYEYSETNYIDVNTIQCDRGSTNNLATGTLSYIAIGR